MLIPERLNYDFSACQSPYTPPNPPVIPPESSGHTPRILRSYPPNPPVQPPESSGLSPLVSVSGVEGSEATRDTRHPTLRATRENSWPRCCAICQTEPPDSEVRNFAEKGEGRGAAPETRKAGPAERAGNLGFPKSASLPQGSVWSGERLSIIPEQKGDRSGLLPDRGFRHQRKPEAGRCVQCATGRVRRG